ncbi:hypothetical protein CEXT_250411 [Caerostris extrusa]|uniref:Uncharacterized protein n=1 Tax=Caerostris extrusa TaxID=172846 RepID=A0AAV4TN99_CAEEX|nr:hypothetical protein CEXT_250411 [Caerostris extrusa]
MNKNEQSPYILVSRSRAAFKSTAMSWPPQHRHGSTQIGLVAEFQAYNPLLHTINHAALTLIMETISSMMRVRPET